LVLALAERTSNALLLKDICEEPHDDREVLALVVGGEYNRVLVGVGGRELVLHRQRNFAVERVHHAVTVRISDGMDESYEQRQEHPPAVERLKELLCQNLRVTVTDGRIFIGSFAGTDQPLNILLLNTDEFRLGPDENPDGRYVGQILIPWKLVVKAEVQSSGGQHSTMSDYL
jgi:small nuclear ribonucleoprotein (snRNP)-like protein